MASCIITVVESDQKKVTPPLTHSMAICFKEVQKRLPNHRRGPFRIRHPSNCARIKAQSGDGSGGDASRRAWNSCLFSRRRESSRLNAEVTQKPETAAQTSSATTTTQIIHPPALVSLTYPADILRDPTESFFCFLSTCFLPS